MTKLVVCSPNIKSLALKNLANELSRRVGYKVFRVTPDRVRKRRPVVFLKGLDKITQFAAFHRAGVSAPSYAVSLEAAKELPSKQVVVRSLIDSSEGRGITICPTAEVALRAPLYTEYIPKIKEYRVHVFPINGIPTVIDVQEKRRRRVEGGEKEYQVRNTANGYVFCRDNVAPPADCHSVALGAVASLGRSYGAVDVIYNEKRNKCYVLEVNSRPGMQGTTVNKYADAILGRVQ